MSQGNYSSNGAGHSSKMDSFQDIKELPSEILVQIFSYLTFEDLVHSVQHVCSLWREVVQQTNQLWKSIIYNPNCRVSDFTIASILKQAPRLQILILNNNEVGSIALQAITQNCHNLKKLVFNDNQLLNTSDLRDLPYKCPLIEHLSIPYLVLCNSEQSKIIGRLSNLKVLKIRHRFEWQDDRSFVFLKPIANGCPNLQHLCLRNENLSSENLTYFLQKRGSQLHTLSISWYSAERRCNLSLLSMCPALKTLHLHSYDLYCFFNGESGFPTLTTLKNLTCLTFADLGTIDVSDFISLFENKAMDQLEKLYIGCYYNYKDSLANVIVENCPRMKLLGFKCCNLSDRSVEKFHTLPELQGITIHYSAIISDEDNHISDTGMLYIRKCNNLKYLDLRYCRNLTEESMKMILDFSNLKVLKLSFCSVKGLPLDVIATELKHMTLISMNRCMNVDTEAVRELQHEMPHPIVHVCDEVMCIEHSIAFADDPLLEG